MVATYGSSGNFYAQISNGAPFDMYLSADIEYPRELEAAGLAIPGSLFQYAIGRLAIWTSKDSPINIGESGVQGLLHPSVRRISIANPEHAPYGRAALAAIRQLGVYDAVKDKLVFGESVAQALEFVDSGAAQAGVVAMSLAVAPTVAGRGEYWEVPVDSYPAMDQGGIILKRAPDPGLAEDFRAFLLSAEGRGILKDFGFFLPEYSH